MCYDVLSPRLPVSRRQVHRSLLTIDSKWASIRGAGRSTSNANAAVQSAGYVPCGWVPVFECKREGMRDDICRLRAEVLSSSCWIGGK